jgi:hypothetical protein
MKVQKVKVRRVVKANQGDVEFAIKKVTMHELAQIKRNLPIRITKNVRMNQSCYA